MPSEFLIAICAALAASMLVCAVLSRYRGRWALLDIPNDRSLHAAAIPRSGGVGIIAGLLAGYAIAVGALSLPGQIWVLIAFLLIASVSFADDVWRLPPLMRLLVHVSAAALLVFPAGYGLMGISLPGFTWHTPAWVLEGFSVLFIIWMVNLYNFMDGMDGFAGGMACFGFATLALLGALAGSPAYTLGGLAGVRGRGWIPAFQFPACTAVHGRSWAPGHWVFSLPCSSCGRNGPDCSLFGWDASVFSPFIVDATWTVIRAHCRE